MLFTGFRPWQLMSWTTRFKLIVAMLREDWKPVVRFRNGVELDFSTNSVILNQPTAIHARDNLTITSDKHLMMNSGRRQVEGREPGYVYGFWANTDLDRNGDPILDIPMVDLLIKSPQPTPLSIVGTKITR